MVPAAEAVGLKVILGAWLGRDAEHNRREIAMAIELANADGVMVRRSTSRPSAFETILWVTTRMSSAFRP